MKSLQKPLSKDRNDTQDPDERAIERKQGLVLLAIAILFLANVVLYLCHHYGLASFNGWPLHPWMSLGAICG